MDMAINNQDNQFPIEKYRLIGSFWQNRGKICLKTLKKASSTLRTSKIEIKMAVDGVFID